MNAGVLLKWVQTPRLTPLVLSNKSGFVWLAIKILLDVVVCSDVRGISEYVHVGCFGRSFWSGAAGNAVVVEADAFKETDVIYRALSSKGHHQDMLQTAELVNQ